MNKDYISALADALIKHGRRYGLSSTYRNQLIEILSAVPAPVEKSECCRNVPSTQRCGGAEAAGIRPFGEVAAELRESDPSLPKVIQRAVDAGKAARKSLEEVVPVSYTPVITTAPDLYFKADAGIIPAFAVVERDGGGVSLGAPRDRGDQISNFAKADAQEEAMVAVPPVSVSAEFDSVLPAQVTLATNVPEGLNALSTAPAKIGPSGNWRNTGGLPESAPDDYKAASTPAVGFSITGLAQGKGTK